MTTTTFGGLTDAAWDRLAGGRFYSTSAWLRYCEAEYSAPGDAVVAGGGDRVAAVPVRELTAMPEWTRYRWNEHLERDGLPLLAPRGTLVGPPEGFQTHFLGCDGDGAVDAMADLVGLLRATTAAGPDGAERACVAMFVTTPDVVTARRAGVEAEPVLLDADAWIEVPDGGWEAWLDGLTAKRRETVRREVRRFEAAGWRVDHVGLPECCDALGWPAAATLLKHGHRTTAGTELVSLRRMADHLGDGARVALCSRNGEEPAGFCIYFVRGDTVYLRWAGFDDDRLAGAGEYFNVVYYSQVRLAAEIGARWLHAGVAVPEAKALRGAELRPVWLLDLGDDSPLASASKEVRLHNARVHERFAGDPRTAAGLVDEEAWHAFS